MRILAASIFVSLFALGVIAQDDPDPNSPTPILLSLNDSTRALAVTKKGSAKVNFSRVEAQAFAPNSKIVLFVTNLDLMDSEGANAFRVYVEAANGRNFRFPVLDIQPVPTQKGLYALTALLTDEIGYWEPPTADGDLLIGVTWRGLISNRVKLGLGQMGGKIKDDANAKPTPLGTVLEKTGKSSSGSSLSPEYVGYRWSGDRMRFLEQAAFGPTAALDSRIRRIGLRTWLAEQFAAPYPSVSNPYPNFPLKAGNQDDVTAGCGMFLPSSNQTYQVCIRDHYTMYQPQTWFMREAFYSDSQLRHRVAWALQELDVTSGVDIQQGRHMVEYNKILSANAFGNYRDLMGPTTLNPTGGITLNPTMGDYLSMSLSTKTNPNENYAREIMQLFTIGLFMLKQDGTLQLDGTGNPIPTYDQNGVNNLTKVFTGWSYCQLPASCPNVALGTLNFIDPMLLNTNNHDLTAKTLLSYPGSTTTNIGACPAPCTSVADRTTYANASMVQALDNIFNHPNIGPFVSKILIQHLVTSDPTPAYVSRVAAVFNNNGFSVRGDLKAVVRAILLDPEARGDAKTDPNYGKLREPVQFATNLLRTFNVRSANGLSQSDGAFNRIAEFNGMAQVVFMSPTVFNYFPPGYTIPNTALIGPEFAIMTTGTSIQRANFVNRMVFSTVPVNLPDVPTGTSIDLSEMQALAAADATGNLLLDELNRRMMHGTMSSTMKSTILTAVINIASTDPLQRAKQAVYLVATSSQYQVQR